MSDELIRAVILKQPEKIINLLNSGADINYMSQAGNTPLTISIEGKDKNFVELLLKNNADINMPNDTVKTALMIASEYGCNDIVELLLKYGANINYKRNFWRDALGDALTLSIYRKRYDTAILLLNNGAKITFSEHAFDFIFYPTDSFLNYLVENDKNAQELIKLLKTYRKLNE
jgi:ankyrin repeat protein